MQHATNFVLHMATCVLVFWLFCKLTSCAFIGLITAFLFGIHPMRAEAAAWISARKEVLYGFFFMGALLLHFYYRKTRSIAALGLPFPIPDRDFCLFHSLYLRNLLLSLMPPIFTLPTATVIFLQSASVILPLLR